MIDESKEQVEIKLAEIERLRGRINDLESLLSELEQRIQDNP